MNILSALLSALFGVTTVESITRQFARVVKQLERHEENSLSMANVHASWRDEHRKEMERHFTEADKAQRIRAKINELLA